MALPDTRVTAVRRPSLGFSSELLHRPVLLHAASPDAEGRDVHVLEFAGDSSLFAAFGLIRDLELSVVAPLRVYQNGAGVGGVASQADPGITHTALRDPRIGLAYSLDETLHARGLGLRLGLDASLPLGNEQVFSGERSFVIVPSATFGFQRSVLRVSASVGLRFRRAVDFGGVRVGNQAFLALGVGAEVLAPGLLFIGVEAFGSPPLADNRAATAGPLVTEVNLFPAEWLASVHSTFGTANWALGLGAGTGIPLSSETRATSNGPSTAHFLGATTPDFRSLLVLRYTLSAPR
jgi:OOP family OmpA-OmpF porin